ncbi:DUF2059 domain-containing protein [Marimonas lutisalis]|uniref:DUF2059 domain-containing protein n=1 Tax=Marimonas lutisalis TaxID=2545756 RepID=UPI0010F88093|nr:DUF2059 domain-containing protein [Marimonas lutisalis]
MSVQAVVGPWRAALAVFWLVAGALALQADEAEDRAALNVALGIGPLLEIMQEEGAEFGAGIGRDFLPDGGGAGWAEVVRRIYDRDKMRTVVERGMAAELDAQYLPELLAFFRSDRGQRIVAQEIAARRAFLAPETEEMAREAYRNAGAELEKRLELLRAYVEANDLVEFNVAGALNSNLRFFRGLAEGGALDMGEDEMLAQVWEQEEETRADTEEWLMAYLLMAYDDLSDDDISAYVRLSEGAAGKALNRALFAGFDAMYGDVSYALGLAVAAQGKGEDL